MPPEPPAPASLWPDPDALGPVTDLYQLSMMAGYAAEGLADRPAVFELFVRRLPPGRAYLVMAGLEQALGDLLRLRFSAEQVDWLRTLPAFAHIDTSWFDALADFRFRGDVYAAPEGSVVFAGEPLVRVEAPLAQAQWIETFLIASLGYPTLVASKASRVVRAAAGRPVYDYGARRGHGPHAGFLCARSSYLAGFAGTSHVEAARRLGIPCVGTMAHAWVQAFATEPDAFAAYARHYPGAATLLVDTYDTIEGTRRAAAIEPPIRAIRIDSGDLAELARRARSILDDAGRPTTTIGVSGDLDEHKVAALVADGAPIDAFGVGTELITSRDAPAMSMVYKLVAIDGRGTIKKAPGKRTYPLAKQVWRTRDPRGTFALDTVTRADESAPGEPLLVPMVRAGQPAGPWPSLAAIRERCREQVGSLPEALTALDAEPSYPIAYSFALEYEAERLGLRGI